MISLPSLLPTNGLISLSFPQVCILQGLFFQLFWFGGLTFSTQFKAGFSFPVFFNVDFRWVSFNPWLLLSCGVRILFYLMQSKAVGTLRMQC